MITALLQWQALQLMVKEQQYWRKTTGNDLPISSSSLNDIPIDCRMHG